MYNCPCPEPGYISEPYHIPGYTGHIPTQRYRFGASYGRTSRLVMEDPCVPQAPIPVLAPPYNPPQGNDRDCYQIDSESYDLPCEFCPSSNSSRNNQRPKTSCGYRRSNKRNNDEDGCNNNSNNNTNRQQERPQTSCTFPNFESFPSCCEPKIEMEFDCRFTPSPQQSPRNQSFKDRQRERPKTAACCPSSCKRPETRSRNENMGCNNGNGNGNEDYSNLFPECMMRPQTAAAAAAPSTSFSCCRPARPPQNPDPIPDCDSDLKNNEDDGERICWVNQPPVGCTDIGCCDKFLCPQKSKPKKKKKQCDPLPCCNETCDPRAHHGNRSPYACPCRPETATDIYRCCESLPSSYSGHVPGLTFHSNGRTYGKSTFGTKKYMEKCMFYNTFSKQ